MRLGIESVCLILCFHEPLLVSGGAVEPCFHVLLTFFGHFDAKSVCEAGHEVEVAGDEDDRENLLVGEAVLTEGYDVHIPASWWARG